MIPDCPLEKGLSAGSLFDRLEVLHMSHDKKTFLNHVAGLRGWAILLIVWFHLTGSGAEVPAWASLPYGYFGVEIFIVIMGYFLIAGFVRKGDVPLLPFAEGKFMRLLVPTAALVLPALAASLFVVDCEELRAMGKTATAALYGTANHQLIRSTSSYFATDASLNPFLHLWYLSVAVQLFVLGYAGYFVLRRFSRRVVIAVLSLAAFLSYAYSMAEPARLALMALGQACPWTEGCVSYYATLPRLWELLAGGGVLLLPDEFVWNTLTMGPYISGSESSSNLTAAKFSALEEAGAVWLPIAGTMYYAPQFTDYSGAYWTSSERRTTNFSAYLISFNIYNRIQIDYRDKDRYCFSVRLVRDL